MAWFDLAAMTASLSVLMLYFRRSIPSRYELAQLKPQHEAIRDMGTFRTGWAVLALLVFGFFGLEPLGVRVSAVAAVGALLLIVAGRGHITSTRNVLRGAPWEIVIFSLGLYLVVYGLRNAGLTHGIAQLLNLFAQGGVWGAGFGTGILMALLSSVMNNFPAVLVGALSRRLLKLSPRSAAAPTGAARGSTATRWPRCCWVPDLPEWRRKTLCLAAQCRSSTHQPR